ncbi:hypothetical protein [Vulcanisaeta thermophila]|uniref:hypothetical protein n=1 Tax=Vulcanisaeta thermophila TaxID=867917 RepID=UPI00085397DD|nr:hypothetical protein [Vulcanisaeta thermophila]
MTCELRVRDTDGVREYLCNEASVARLIPQGDNYILSIDTVGAWKYPVDDKMAVGDVSLIYWRTTFTNYDAEFVGYDDGGRRELISVRIKLKGPISDDEVKELILRVLKELGNG